MMRQIITATLLALAITSPALAQSVDPALRGPLSGDSEVRAVQSWDREVARANAYRVNQGPRSALRAERLASRPGGEAAPYGGDSGTPVTQAR